MSPDTLIQCLRTPALTNNMGAVTNRDSSVTGRPQTGEGSPVGGGVRLVPAFAFPKMFPPTRKHSPLVSVRETQDPCQRGADR